MITKEKFNTLAEKYFIESLETKDTLSSENGAWKLGKKEVPKAELVELVSQAVTLKDMRLLNIIFDEVKELGKSKIYLESTNEYEIMLGKAILWAVDVIEHKINTLSSLQ